MIPDRQHAVAVSKAAEEFIQRLSLALKAVQANGSHREEERLRRAIGDVIAPLETHLLWPLYQEHPDHEPEDLRGWQQGVKP